MCDAYPGFEFGISEGPAGSRYARSKPNRKNYSTFSESFNYTFYRGFPPRCHRSTRKNPFENYYSWDSNQTKEEYPEATDYKFMGLKKSCSEEDLKKRYYKLAKEYHPDRSTGSHNLFVKLKQAYDNIKSIFIS